jgi:AraC-like DNA-binding protein
VHDLLPPSPALKPYVEGFWQRRGFLEKEKKIRVLPDACTKMLFELAPTPWPSCYVVGTQLAPMIYTLAGEVDRIGVRFRLGMASFFLGRPLRAMAGRYGSFEHLGINGGEELLERLRASSSFEVRVDILDGWLLSRFAELQPDPEQVCETSRLAQALLRGVPPPALSEMMGWSQRQLQRICRHRFGASAANLHRFHRFEILQSRLASGPPDLARLAAELGFADQAHMAREFRSFAGTTISAFLREQAAVGNLQDDSEWLRVLRDAEELCG